jgi:hypothetical protein
MPPRRGGRGGGRGHGHDGDDLHPPPPNLAERRVSLKLVNLHGVVQPCLSRREMNSLGLLLITVPLMK